MKRIALMMSGLVVVGGLAASGVRAQDTGGWLHVRVEEQEKKVRVNLPLNVVEAALRAGPEILASEGRIHLGRKGRGPSVSELRAMWKELKATGDAELVSVDDKDEKVKVERAGELVRVRVERSGKEQVYVEVPVSVVDALLTAEGDALDVRSALRELRKRRGDIVRVDEENSKVRVWIDESQKGEPR